MKKILSLISGLCALSAGQAQTGNPAPYCVSQFDNNYNMIQSVNVNGSNFTTGPVGSWSSQNSYTFFTNATFPNLAPGSTATIGISFFSITDWEPRYFGVWIDFNGNNTFDASELIMNNAMTTNTDLPTGGGSPQLISLPVTIPANAMSGTTRMRVVRSQAPTGSPYVAYSPTVQVLACNPLASNQAYGCTYDFNLNIVSGNAPAADFSITPVTPCSGKPVYVTDLSSNAPSTWTWVAVGATNTLSAVQNPTLNYANAGTYTIALLSANAAGTSTLATKTITVIASPQLTITPFAPVVCAKKTITLTALGAETYSWSSGPTQSLLLVSPSVTTVYTLTGTNGNVCSSSLNKTVTVNPCTGISESHTQESRLISIFPNPGNGMLTIITETDKTKQEQLIITTVLGKVIVQQSLEDSQTLQLPEAAPGIYFIQISDNTGSTQTYKYLLH